MSEGLVLFLISRVESTLEWNWGSGLVLAFGTRDFPLGAASPRVLGYSTGYFPPFQSPPSPGWLHPCSLSSRGLPAKSVWLFHEYLNPLASAGAVPCSGPESRASGWGPGLGVRAAVREFHNSHKIPLSFRSLQHKPFPVVTPPCSDIPGNVDLAQQKAGMPRDSLRNKEQRVNVFSPRIFSGQVPFLCQPCQDEQG